MSKSMNIFLIGDGPLANELAVLIEAAGHDVTIFFLDEATSERKLDELVSSHVELALEVVVAEPTEKWDAITELEQLLTPESPILSASLNAGATEVASWCHNPERLVGFAALPPLAETTVIEFMPALQSSPAAIEKARTFWQSLGCEAVQITDSVGGVLPRVVCNLVNEAAFALMEGIATPEDIDLAMQLGTNYPRGPLAWGDKIGLGQVVGILEALGNEFGPDQYRPAPLLRQYARAKKSFYG